MKERIPLSDYPLSWITEQLAVGHAPMSYDELDSIRRQGIDGIVNLCGEYCDLHEIERGHGFEVYYLPVEDNQAPSLPELEKALQWLDEAVYLGKKVLIHCTHGIGRTGTFLTAYLLRRGFSLKLARQRLRRTRAESTSFNQWWFLRKFGKKEGKLTIREPSLEGSRIVDLGSCFLEYRALLEEAESALASPATEAAEVSRCGRDTDACCTRFFHLGLVEAAYLSHHLNRRLTSEERLKAIQRGIEVNRLVCSVSPGKEPRTDDEEESCLAGTPGLPGYRCPLSVERKCIAFPYRPLICRMYDLPGTHDTGRFTEGIRGLSRKLFFELNGVFMEGDLLFPMPQVVSGKFVEAYFKYITRPARS
ncbi:MAG: dual specificity protein phosphatase family protein [Thermodesulfobacteriota bacterium]